MKKIVPLAFVLVLLSTAVVIGSVRPAVAQGTIYIRANGLVEGTDKIVSVDNVTYTFTDNITDEIVVERSNIIIDGKGYTVQGSGSGNGFYWYGINNVTVKNTNIKDFAYGVFLAESNNSAVSGNNITKSTEWGVYLWSSNTSAVSGNTITKSTVYGVSLGSSSNITVSGNTITNNYYDIYFFSSSNNNSISGNIITNSAICGIRLDGESSNNKIYHNNFVDNPQHASVNPNSLDNVWDDGYPSGGNYWSDYEERYPNATEIDDSGIWDTPYVIDENN
jgi:parallel beta-helix repeat protein